MSQFFSLDDDDDENTAGPSNRGSLIRESLASPSTSSRSQSIHRGNASTSSQNPIYALLEGEAGGSRGIGNGSTRQDKSRDPRQNGLSGREEVPIKQLQTAWVCERGCPELLDWRGDAVDDVCSQIEEQMTIVESLAADASTAEEEHVRLGLVEIDVERARWLLKSYLRCRLDKIERHAAYLKQDERSRSRMSDLEKGYCVKFAEMQADHFESSVLEFLPSNLRSLDDKAESGSNGRGDMVTRPDLDAPVFIRCLQDCGQFQFKGHDDLVPFVKGSIHFVRYSTVRTLIEDDRIEVL